MGDRVAVGNCGCNRPQVHVNKVRLRFKMHARWKENNVCLKRCTHCHPKSLPRNAVN